jgi:hypothetical protein
LKFFSKYLLVAALLVAACDPQEPTQPVDKGLDYFPLQTGMYAVYQVSETRYSQLSEPETLAYELMTEVVDSFGSGSGEFTFVIHRFQRPDANSEWTFLDTWSARSNSIEAVVTEENTPFIKLSFPLREGSLWDGNRRNNLEKDEYQVKNIDLQLNINDLTFDSTVLIEQESYDDEITRTDLRTEIYARDVGLIMKETTQLIYCTEEVCLNDKIIESGTIFKQEIKEYGTH